MIDDREEAIDEIFDAAYSKVYFGKENEILNDVFKRLVSVASIARKEDLTVDGELVVPDFAVQSQSAKGE